MLSGEISLPAFQDWLGGATWDIEERGDAEAIDLTYDVKLALAELSRSGISLTAFHERLSDALGTPVGAQRLR